jgi:hypothetical protein
MPCGRAARRTVRAAVHVTGAAAAVLLLVVVAASLTNKEYRPSDRASAPHALAACLLDGFDGVTSRRACSLAYLLAATSISFNSVVVVLIAVAASGLHLPNVVETVVAAFLCLWWLGGGATIAYFSIEANRAGWAGQGPRSAALALAGLLGVLYLVAAWTSAVAGAVRAKADDRGGGHV